jgi:aldehyde:ferredoxin oxidoreductase
MEKGVDPVMKEKFIGGKGYGLKLLWDATTPDTRGMTLKMRLS